MSVKVRTTRYDSGQAIEETHEKGSSFEIRDGHLFVVRWDGGGWMNVAAYAPGKWEQVDVSQDA